MKRHMDISRESKQRLSKQKGRFYSPATPAKTKSIINKIDQLPPQLFSIRALTEINEQLKKALEETVSQSDKTKRRALKNPT